ncbi:uncharacterized protein [Drosophila bipectinata]|uniref:uncharacterized protein isoform X1 n=1 Tax=Drosophila bipectinata TaxID=42026 RepID=UPI0038B32A32
MKSHIEEIMELFPLPTKPSEYCHDAYLKKILPEKEAIPKKVNVTDGMPGSKDLKTRDTLQEHEVFDAMLYRVDYAARATVYMNRMTSLFKSSLSQRQRDSIFATTLMFKTRFQNLISDFSSVCVIFQLMQLRELLNVMRDIPPEGTDPTNTIFGWCYKEKLRRFEEQHSSVYIDIFEEDKSQVTLDELKFYVDLGEVIRLVDVLISDVSSDPNFNNLTTFNDAISNTTEDVDKIIALPYESQMAIYKGLYAEKFNKNQGFHNEHLANKQRKLRKIQSEIYYISPISTRYRINWTYDKAQQGQFYLDLRCKEYSNKLEKIRHLKSKDMSVWDSVNSTYRILIESYKQQINTVQEDYDTDMELAENMVQLTRNRVSKCKDDLQHAKETVQMFKRRVQEVLDKIAQQKELERIEDEKKTEVEISKTVRKSDTKKKNRNKKG